MFMSPDQLRQLSGGRSKKRVTEWLTDNGYEFQVGLDGWPRVLTKTVEKRLGIKKGNGKQSSEPDLSWIN